MRPRARSGMTLLEVVVALTIAGVALAAGASVIGFLADEQSRQQASSVGRTVATREMLRDWLASAALSTSGDTRFMGMNAARDNEPARAAIDFVTTAETPVALGGDARTRIRIGLTSDSRVTATLTALPRGRSVELEIADSALAFDVRYLPSLFGAVRWMRGWSSTSVLPALVELRIGSRDPLLAAPLTVVVAERR